MPHPVLPSAPWHHTPTLDQRRGIREDRRVCAASPARCLVSTFRSPRPPPTHLWQARLTPTTKPYPGSHHNNGVEIIPISVLLQTLSVAAAECGGSALSDIRFEYPIVVDEPRLIQVVADGASVTVSSASGSAQHWIRHVTARIARGSDDRPAAAAVAGRQVADGEFADDSVTSLWQTWGSAGRPFGWSIGSCRSAAGELRADVELTQASSVALLDAAIHIGRLLDSENPRLMVPSAVAGVRFDAELADPRGRVEVRRRGGNDRRAHRRHRGDRILMAARASTCADFATRQ